tara:strand:+ start:426 stop:605 length:180 start_codon:yes stop_codon:yes gene_type:complete
LVKKEKGKKNKNEKTKTKNEKNKNKNKKKHLRGGRLERSPPKQILNKKIFFVLSTCMIL